MEPTRPDRGVRVALGGCLDLGESGPAYVAIVQALRHLFQQLEPTAVQELVGSDRSTLARVIPELLDEDEAQVGGLRSRPMAQTRLFDRLVGVLDRASSAGPLAFELEDIHWADPSTRAFLQYLVANSSATGLLVIATFRTEEAGRDHPLASVLRQLDRDPQVTRIDLRPFDKDELREQLHGILGELPTDRLLAAINARSEGNALFAEELVATGGPKLDLPASIGAALLARTEGLSRDTRLALRVASVAGRSVSYGILRSATALPDDRLGDALREAVAANILEPEHVGERYRFRHALLREAIYEDALPGERQRLHAAVAGALEDEARDRPDDADLAPQLAYHWVEANDHDRALAASLVAGDAAVRQLAYAEGLQHYERVLDLWGKASEPPVGLSLAEALVRASHIAWNAGEPEKTVALGRRALDELGETGDRVLRVRALDEVARALDDIGRFGEATPVRTAPQRHGGGWATPTRTADRAGSPSAGHALAGRPSRCDRRHSRCCAALQVTSVGYKPQVLPIVVRDNETTDITITLQADSSQMNEVVVTALGIKREQKTIGFASQQVTGAQLTQSQQPNLINALQGKVAGVTISSTGGGPGQGASILIRGINSLNPDKDNQPLFVIDGLPVDNSTYTVGTTGNRGTQMSNRISDINPEDIENVNILRGGAATALYGLRGANGVVVITTKSGRAGTFQVHFSSSYSWDEVDKYPDLQLKYTMGFGGKVTDYDNTSFWPAWGPTVAEAKTVDPAHPDELWRPGKRAYNTGHQFRNSVSFSGGN